MDVKICLQSFFGFTRLIYIWFVMGVFFYCLNEHEQHACIMRTMYKIQECLDFEILVYFYSFFFVTQSKIILKYSKIIEYKQ